MSGWLPLGYPAHTVFISCQMLFLIILSFPVVPPPRQHETPISSPASPLEVLENSFPSLLTPLYSPTPTAPLFLSFEHCIPSSLLHLLGSHPLLSVDSHVWERLRVSKMLALWSFRLRCFTKWMQELYSHPCLWDTGRYINLENITSWSIVKLQRSHNFTGDHSLGILYWTLVNL